MSETLEAPAVAEEPQPQATEAPAEPVPPTPEETAAHEAEAAAKSEASKADRRFARLTARARSQEAEIAELRKLVPQPEPRGDPTPDDLIRQGREIERVETRTKAFNDECNKVAATGVKEYGDDFHSRMTELWSTVPPASATPLIEAAIETGHAHKVLYALAADPDEAERIAGLSPARMGVALAKLAAPPTNALIKPPEQSKAPDPIKPLKQGGGAPEPRLDGGDQKEFEAAFRKMRERGR